MIKTYAEILSTLQNLDFGEPIYKLDISRSSIQFTSPSFPGKEALDKDDWIQSIISYRVSRSFNKETNKLQLHKEVLPKINEEICSRLMNTMEKCSTVKDMTRTSLWKDYKKIINKHGNNVNFLSDIFNIINYYQSSKTDTICKLNVIGLLELLRKKYGTASAGSAAARADDIPF